MLHQINSKKLNVLVISLFLVLTIPAIFQLPQNETDLVDSIRSKIQSPTSDYFVNYTINFGDILIYDMALDTLGNQYVVGTSTSASLATVNAYQASNAGGADVVVAKIDINGNIDYLTYLGSSGTEQAYSIQVDSAGNGNDAIKFGAKDYVIKPFKDKQVIQVVDRVLLISK